jgi:hypothetical protein
MMDISCRKFFISMNNLRHLEFNGSDPSIPKGLKPEKEKCNEKIISIKSKNGLLRRAEEYKTRKRNETL